VASLILDLTDIVSLTGNNWPVNVTGVLVLEGNEYKYKLGSLKILCMSLLLLCFNK
jgi:hypothetical protein